jgi:hypothetical protein
MRRLTLIATVLAAAVLAGCAQKSITTVAETEGTWVDVGPLTYQVQISRYMNPNDVEDQSYFIGLPPGTKPVGKNEVWFGVFMRIKNYSGETQTSADTFTMTDTEGLKYQPIALDTKINPFAYAPAEIPHAGVWPKTSSVAGSGPIEGGLLLFRLKAESLQNRPLELHIQKAGVAPALISIDL